MSKQSEEFSGGCSGQNTRRRLIPFRLIHINNAKYTNHAIKFSPFKEPAATFPNFRVSHAATSKRKQQLDQEDEADSNTHRALKQQRVHAVVHEDLAKPSINHQINDLELTERELWLAANAYDNLLEWRELASHLGLTSAEIQTIEFKYSARDGLAECLYQSLLKWRVREPERCNLNELCSILRDKFNKNVTFLNTFAYEITRTSREAVKTDERNRLGGYLKSLSNKSSSVKADQSLDSVQVEEKHLWAVSEHVCGEWKSVARALGLPESSLIQIEHRHMIGEGVRECAYQSLLAWLQQASRARLEDVCVSLIRAKFNLYARQLMEVVLF
jgi:hypothetical protein